jgi:hypothetical protein
LLLEALFDKVFAMCIEKGMVAGHTHAVDSAPIKANASIENLELKVAAQSINAHFIPSTMRQESTFVQVRNFLIDTFKVKIKIDVS